MVCEEEEEGRRRELPVWWKVVKVTFLVSGLSCSSLSSDTVSRLVSAGRAGLTEEVLEVSALFLLLQVRERMRASPRQRVTTLTALVTRIVRNFGS